MTEIPKIPSLFLCCDCGNTWYSKSEAKHPSCSKCHKKRTFKIDPSIHVDYSKGD